jgi:predicted small lipoprotein YifL
MTKRLTALIFSGCLMFGAVAGCGDSYGPVVEPPAEDSSTEVPGGEMSEEEYAKELEKSMR